MVRPIPSLLRRGARRLAPGIVALALLAPASPAAAAEPDSAVVRGWQTGLLRPDRLRHASLSFSLGLGVGLAADSPPAGAGAALAVGLAKELADRRASRFDAYDLLADAAGAALAAWAVSALRR